MTNEQLAKKMIELMGGKLNINRSWHCITRLRFNVNNKDKIKLEEIKHLDGVMGAQFQSGQFQIIIGAEVANVYAEINKLLGDQIGPVGSTDKKNLLEMVFDVISGIFTPIITAISAAGLLKGIMALLVAMNLLSETGSNYEVLTIISDATFHFLPFLIAFSAAKKFDTDGSLAVSLAGILMYPKILEYAAGGEVASLKFLGLSVPMNSYASSVLPIILGVFLLSVVHRGVSKVVPNSLRIIFTPLLSLLITAPITLIFIAPLGNYIGVYLEQFFTMMFNIAGPLAGLLMGGLMPLIVITGMHYAFFPSTFASFDKFGYDIMLLPMNFVANMAQAGAVLGVMLKTKDKGMKQLSFSTFIPALFGITEPAIYGVTIKLKKPFYASLAGGAVGGAIYGLFNVKNFAFTVPGIMSLPTYLEKGTANFMLACVGVFASFSVAFVLTLLMKVDGPQTGITQVKRDAQVTGAKSMALPQEVLSPLSGKVLPLESVADATFAEGLVGKGVAIMPTEGIVKAPFNGEITMLTPTNHAIGLISEEGVEMLIHIGLETVTLKGEGFDLLVEKNQRVVAGQPLMTFDLASLRAKNVELISPVVVVNSAQFLDVVHTAEQTVRAGETNLLIVVN